MAQVIQDYVQSVGRNADDRLVVLNRVAHSVIEARRGQHSSYVFSFRGKALTRMLNTGWKRVRNKAGLLHVRVHDLKHTFSVAAYGLQA